MTLNKKSGENEQAIQSIYDNACVYLSVTGTSALPVYCIIPESNESVPHELHYKQIQVCIHVTIYC